MRKTVSSGKASKKNAVPGNILNTRQRDILLALLHSEGPITLSRLAQRARINPRMVRYTLTTVEAWLRFSNTKVIRRPGFGIYIDASKAQRKQLVSAIERMGDFDLVLTSQQRCRAILLILLTSQKPITFTALARQIEISRSAVFRDFRDVEQWLNRHSLHLVRTLRKGVSIGGMEAARRHALVQLIHDELGPKNWVLLAEDAEGLQGTAEPEMDHFRVFLDGLELSYCRRMVLRIERGLGYELTKAAKAALQLKLAIAIHALKDGLVETEFHAENTHGTLEFQIAELAATDIQERFGITMEGSELELLAIHIQHGQVSPSFSFSIKASPDPLANSKQYIGLAQAIIARAAMQLHPWLLIDPQLTIDLALHLSSNVPYLRHGFGIRNKLVQQVKSTYSNVWEIAKSAAEVITEDEGVPVPEEEIGYLTMYFAAALERLRKVEERRTKAILVSTEENSLLVLLHARITAEFPTIQVVEVANSLNRKIDPEQIDLVLTTYPLDNLSVPTIEVNPFLIPADIDKIRLWLGEKAEAERLAEKTTKELPNLVDLLDVDSVICGARVDSWKEAVERAGAPLVAQSRIEARYIDAMKDILTQYGPFAVIAPGVAVLHARPSDGVVSLCLGLLLLGKGVDFGHKDFDPVDIVFVLGAINESAHLLALKQLISLIRDGEFLRTIRLSRTPSDALRAIWKFLPSQQSVETS